MDSIRLSTLFSNKYPYLLIIISGIILSISQVDKLFFWEDEVSTIMHTSGITLRDFPNQIPQDSISSIAVYEEIIALNNGSYPLKDQVSGLLEMPQFTPAHYFFLTIWHRLVGDDTTSFRYFSIFVFILSLPFLFLLSRRITKSDKAAWMTTALYSVTPFMLQYAVEARYYILWVFVIVILHLSFIKAIENSSRKNWILYVLATTISLYVSLFSALAIIGQILYVIFFQKKKILQFGIVLGSALLMYLPWIYFLWVNYNTMKAAMAWQVSAQWGMEMSTIKNILGQLIGLSGIFYPEEPSLLNATYTNTYGSDVFFWNILLAIASLFIIGGFVFAIRKLKYKGYGWMLSLFLLPNFIFFLSLDILRGGYISHIPRYQMVSYVAVFLVIGYVLAQLVKKNKAFYAVYFLLIGACIFTNIRDFSEPCTNRRFDCQEYVDSAAILNNTGKTLIISNFNSNLMNFYSLILQTNNDDIDILYTFDPLTAELKQEIENSAYHHVFLTHVSESLEKTIRNDLSGIENINVAALTSSYDWAVESD